jgi:hypothetical protein
LRELVPQTVRLAVLVNPNNAAYTEATVKGVRAAARAMALQFQVFEARTSVA